MIAGLANSYADYTTTFEEYQAQRYEAGSTIYGPHQLQAYTQIAVQLATAVVSNGTVPAGTKPTDYHNKVVKSLGKPDNEEPPSGQKMGDNLVNPKTTPYVAGTDSVSVSFLGSNPRNNVRLGGTYLEIQTQPSANATWTTHATDGDVETRVHFAKKKYGSWNGM